MRTLKRFCIASVLMFVLALPALAGEISTTVAPPSSPTQGLISTPDRGEMTTSVNGDIHTGDTEQATVGDAVAEAALSLLQGVWSLL